MSADPVVAPADTYERECIECLMAWFLYGDGAICLYHQERVFWKGRRGTAPICTASRSRLTTGGPTMPEPVSPADTIRTALTFTDAHSERYALAALDALLAVGERDKAEIDGLQAEVQRLADRAVCSGCGSDVGESGVCPYPDCYDGEMIPASDLPVALRNRCDSIQEDRAEWRSDWEGLRAEAKELERAGERDRQHIAQLTEALEQIAVEIRPGTLAASLSADQHVAALWEVVRHYSATARAVLADKEDAG